MARAARLTRKNVMLEEKAAHFAVTPERNSPRRLQTDDREIATVARRRPLLFDSSVLIPMIRGEAYEELFQRALRTGRARLSSVVMQELYAGARTRADKRNYDGINQAFIRQGYVVTPSHEDWALSGVLLAQHQQRYGELEPRNHINDLLIALGAVRAGAELVTENVTDMERWRKMLSRSGNSFSLQTVTRSQ